MLRWLTHILDIKNLLGMQRNVVPPIYPPYQLVLRSNGGTAVFRLSPTETVTIDCVINGIATQYQTSASYPIHIPADADTDIVITGNVQHVETGQHIIFLATSDYITNGIGVGVDLKTVDLRNYTGGAVGYTTINVNEVYSKPGTYAQLSAAETIIGNSTEDGVVWIDMTQNYASALKTYAETEGWTVYEL